MFAAARVPALGGWLQRERWLALQDGEGDSDADEDGAGESSDGDRLAEEYDPEDDAHEGLEEQQHATPRGADVFESPHPEEEGECHADHADVENLPPLGEVHREWMACMEVGETGEGERGDRAYGASEGDHGQGTVAVQQRGGSDGVERPAHRCHQQQRDTEGGVFPGCWRPDDHNDTDEGDCDGEPAPQRDMLFEDEGTEQSDENWR